MESLVYDEVTKVWMTQSALDALKKQREKEAEQAKEDN